jgi:hypothetical protein
MQILTYNGEMKVLFSEFHHINLTALLLGKLGSKNKTAFSELRKKMISSAPIIQKVYNMKLFCSSRPSLGQFPQT